MADDLDIRCSLDDVAGLVAEIRRRDKIINALMNHVQRNLNSPNSDFSLLQKTFILEEEVTQRTVEMERALDALAKTKKKLQTAYSELEQRVVERTAEVSKQLHFLQQLIEAMPGPVFYKDAELRYLGCNRAYAAMLGIPAAELIGKKPEDVFIPELAAQVIAADREMMARGGTQIYERTIRFPNGELRDVLFHKAAFLKPDESVGGLVGIVLDITERKRLETQLRESQKMDALGKLAGGIAHDFNNLLTVITGYGEILRAALKQKPLLREQVEQILQAGEQAGTLTRQLLAFTRQQVVQPRLLDMRSVVVDAGKLLRPLITEDLELTIAVDSEPCLAVADVGQIQQIILNLVINARDATREGGKIRLSVDNVAREDETERLPLGANARRYVRLVVSDTGHGMDAETRARIFEPFFTTKEQGKGTGLGLATVYGIVQQTAGHIAVESEPGRGATFYVYLQSAEGALQETARARNQQKERALFKGSETILVVEDQPGLRTLTCEILRRSGYTVIAAENGREALAVANRHAGNIDLMITDVIMPEMGGREIAERLPGTHPETKVLYMSGYVNDVNELLASGHAFVDKPFSSESLLRKVREILDGASQRSRCA